MKALNNVLKSFQKTLTALEDLYARNTAVANQKFDQAMALEEEASELRAEAQKAQEIHRNLKELLGQ